MSAKDELRQSLLELHYDLLDEEEAAKLRAAIETDPEVASEWASTLRLAGKLADAAKIQGTSLPGLNIPSLLQAAPSANGQAATSDDDSSPVMAQLVKEPPAPDKQTDDRPTDGETHTKVRPTGNLKSWWIRSAAIAATAASIGFLVIGSWYVDRAPRQPAAVLRLQAEATPGHQAAAENEFRFVTSRLDATSAGTLPVTPASLSFSVLARGSVLFNGTAETGSDGTGRVVLPSELAIPSGARLRVTARSADGTLSESTLEVPLEPTRCLTHLTVDRPVYRPGETVFFRSLTLQRRSLQASVDVPIRFELIDPSGAMVPGAFTEGVSDRGVGNGSFTLPSTAPGGSYTLVAKSLDGFFPEERRDFQVRAYRVPRFKKEIEFRRRSYGPGETVEAEFVAERAEGGALAGVPLQVTAVVDDEVIYQQATTTSPAGTCVVSFLLPQHIGQGAGRLSIAVDDGSTQETQTKTIPIQLGRVEVEFYPEGGYLVDGLKNRVYFAARDSLGDPVHIAGEILTRSGQSVAEVETIRDGMGRFSFVPRRGERYVLKVTAPVDVTNTPRLPAVVKDLPVIDTGVGVFAKDKPISVIVRSKTRREAIVRAVCRGQLVGEKKTRLRVGDNTMLLPVRDDASGVIRVTVIDVQTNQPLVERLVFRRHEKQLQVDVVEAESELERSPGEPLRLTLQVRDESGHPTPAVLGVSVVDDAAISLDETERPTLRTHFLLTSEVQSPEDLEHANFYLSDNPDAGESLDLLLGTQGWRRFISGSASEADVDFRGQLIRLLELDGDDNVAAAPQRFDNRSHFEQRFEKYRAAIGVAWEKLLIEARFLMLAILAIWLFAIVIRLRHPARSSVAGLLLITSVSWFVYGCSSQEAMVAPGAAALESADMQMAEESASEHAEMEMDMAMANAAPMAKAVPEETAPPPLPMPEARADAAKDVDESTIESAPKPADSAQGAGAPDSLRNRNTGGEFGDWEGDEKYALTGRSVAENLQRLISQQDLQRLLTARGLDADALADQLLDELRFPIRQYAHQHRKSKSGVREDFTETLYWQPMLITDSTGKATIRFDLSDSVTTFRINVDGHSGDGRIGSGDNVITSRLPFQIEPKLPLEVTTGDRIDLPIAVINATDTVVGVELSLKTDDAIELIDGENRMLSLVGKERSRQHISLNVLEGSAETDAMIEIRGVAGGSLGDTVRRPVHVSPAGYPARQSLAGTLNESAKIRLPIPRDMVDGSLAVTIRAYPSPLADVMSGVESILREPHGCFEQTSATNYPNTMALLYLQENEIANPDVSRRARGMLDRGYQKLTSFECRERGYEWFGKDPGHEALSAFGLMQFTDMARVMAVSDEMMVRTRRWLMGRRDGQGGFHRNPRHLHVWSVQQEIVNAYVLWAITEADVATGHDRRAASELAAELDQLADIASRSDDPYLIALSAATLLNVKRTSEGEQLLRELTELQADDGSLQGKTTVTSSGGISRKMETTALATLAWLKSPQFGPQARAAAEWITKNRSGNSGFGSTQATVLALKALVAMSDRAAGQSGGQLEVLLHGETIGQAALPSQPASGSTVEIQGLGAHLQDAQSNVEIELVARGVKNLPYTIDLAYHAITPKSDAACPMVLSTEMTGDGKTKAGDTLTVKTRMENVTPSGQPMTVAIVGLPGGVEPRAEELDELRDAGKFDYYELRGREVIFYWRTVEPRAVKEIDFTVTATVPGRYTGPASRAYLYYTAEQKHWIEPLEIEISR